MPTHSNTPSAVSNSASYTHSNATPLLSVQAVCKSFAINGLWQRERFFALRNIDLILHRGETLGIIGESGSGKSTLARIIAKLTKADSGEVRLHGEDILPLSPQAFAPRRRDIQLIFQDPQSALNPLFRIERILQEPLIGFRMGNAAERSARIRRMLPMVGLEESVLRRYPPQLSGGQKQRVAILSALLVEPQVVIADEIVSALDLSVQAQILNLWRDIQAELHLSTLFISHDLQVVGWLADRIVVMLRGHIVEQGLAEDICLHPHHPYTQLLFAARDLEVDDVVNLERVSEDGCPFYARCTQRQDRCQHHMPSWTPVAPDHSYRCWQ